MMGGEAGEAEAAAAAAEEGEGARVVLLQTQ